MLNLKASTGWRSIMVTSVKSFSVSLIGDQFASASRHHRQSVNSSVVSQPSDLGQKFWFQMGPLNWICPINVPIWSLFGPLISVVCPNLVDLCLPYLATTVSSGRYRSSRSTSQPKIEVPPCLPSSCCGHERTFQAHSWKERTCSHPFLSMGDVLTSISLIKEVFYILTVCFSSQTEIMVFFSKSLDMLTNLLSADNYRLKSSSFMGVFMLNMFNTSLTIYQVLLNLCLYLYLASFLVIVFKF